VTLLFLRAPRGATAVVNCKGAGCPYRRIKRTVRNGSLRIRSLERTLRPGTLIRVAITQGNRIGSYTSFLMRNGRAARRRDRCLYPGSAKPRLCPDQ
jgi:hypothetical protein